MSESFIQVPPDGSGKKQRSLTESISGNEVHSHTIVLLGWDGINSVLRKVLIDDSGKLKVLVDNAIDITDEATRQLGLIYGSQNQTLLQRASTYDLLIQLRQNGVEIDPRDIRLLTSSDVVSALKSGTWNIDNLLNPHPVTQTTRVNMTVKPEREDLTSLGGTASPNANGALIIAGEGGKKIKVYDAGYHAGAVGTHYFYFGTDTSPTTRRFCTANKALLIHKIFPNPRIGNDGDGLYLYSSVNDPNIPYDLGYVKE